MAIGLYLTPDGMVMVEYGTRKMPISAGKYRANGYKPSLKKLMEKPRSVDKSQVDPDFTRLAGRSRRH
jgi:hypothetical protein